MIAFEEGMMVRGHPIVLADGDYLLPVYHETGEDRDAAEATVVAAGTRALDDQLDRDPRGIARRQVEGDRFVLTLHSPQKPLVGNREAVVLFPVLPHVPVGDERLLRRAAVQMIIRLDDY